MQNDIVFWKFFENKGFLSFDAGNPLCIMEFDARRDVSLWPGWMKLEDLDLVSKLKRPKLLAAQCQNWWIDFLSPDACSYALYVYFGNTRIWFYLLAFRAHAARVQRNLESENTNIYIYIYTHLDLGVSMEENELSKDWHSLFKVFCWNQIHQKPNDIVRGYPTVVVCFWFIHNFGIFLPCHRYFRYYPLWWWRRADANNATNSS